MSKQGEAGPAEVWASIPGYEGLYVASTEGQIRRLCSTGRDGRPWKGRVLKQGVTIHGYLKVCLSRNNKRRTFSVHRLVCLAFRGLPGDGREVAHIDGVKHNNVANNLVWVSHAENECMKRLHGTAATGQRNGAHTRPWARPRGERHGMSKLTEEQVLAIRKAHSQCNIGAQRLAKIAGVSKRAVQQILARKHWSHI